MAQNKRFNINIQVNQMNEFKFLRSLEQRDLTLSSKTKEEM